MDELLSDGYEYFLIGKHARTGKLKLLAYGDDPICGSEYAHTYWSEIKCWTRDEVLDAQSIIVS